MKLAHAFPILALALLAACGGGGGGGGSDYDLAGDPNLVGSWTFDAGVHPMTDIVINSNGTYTGEFVNGCIVGGKWLVSGYKLKFTVTQMNSGALCSWYDLDVGSAMVMGYGYVSINRVTVADDSGTSWYDRVL